MNFVGKEKFSVTFFYFLILVLLSFFRQENKPSEKLTIFVYGLSNILS